MTTKVESVHELNASYLPSGTRAIRLVTVLVEETGQRVLQWQARVTKSIWKSPKLTRTSWEIIHEEHLD